MATLVDPPSLAGLDPAPHKVLVPRGHEIIEWASHNCGGREHAIVRTILDVAMCRKAVQDEESATGLGGKFGVTGGTVGKKVVYGKRLGRSKRSDGPSEVSGDVAPGHG